MPRRTTTTTKSAAPTPADRKPAARKAAPGGGGASGAPKLQTFAQATGARPTEFKDPHDGELMTRSFQLRRGDVERLRAAADGVRHLTYGTPLEDEIPDGVSAMITEAIRAQATHYEDMLHDGEEFRRVRKLKSGPTRKGAWLGAQKRSAAAAAKRAARAQEAE